jgi:hypothetical protein
MVRRFSRKFKELKSYVGGIGVGWLRGNFLSKSSRRVDFRSITSTLTSAFTLVSKRSVKIAKPQQRALPL